MIADRQSPAVGPDVNGGESGPIWELLIHWLLFAVRWTASVRTAGEANWQDVAQDKYLERDRVLPTERRAEVYVELRPSRGVLLGDVCSSVIASVLSICIPVCSRLGLEVKGVQLSRVFFALILLVMIIVNTVVAVAFTRTHSEAIRLHTESAMCVLMFLNITMQHFHWFWIWTLNGFIWVCVGVFLLLEFDYPIILVVGFLKLLVSAQVLGHRWGCLSPFPLLFLWFNYPTILVTGFLKMGLIAQVY